MARGITDDRAAQALKASTSPIDGLTSKTKSKRIKRQAQRFLGWREKKRANMVDKEKLDLEIRLTAIEYLLINMGKAVYLTAQVPAEKMREMRENARTQLLSETFPGVDPSMGDHVGAELADRVEYLLGEIEILVADAYQQLDQQRKA